MTVTLAPTDHVDRFLNLLEGLRQTGNDQWEARCPAHDDHSPSLGVSIGREGQVLHNCLAGCEFDTINAALSIRPEDLWPAKPTNGHRSKPKITRYTYVDEQRTPLYDVVRTVPGRNGKAKSFHQEPASGKRGRGAMDGVRLVLYRLPEVIEAVNAGRTIWIVEGEKDADALARVGEVATCNPKGAGSWHKVPDAPDVLMDATLIIWVDDDKAGHDHGRKVARSIDGKAEGWIVVRSRSAKDAAEHLGAGRPLDLEHGLEELAASDGDRSWLNEPGAASDDTPTHEGSDAPDRNDEDPPSSWQPIDLADALDGKGPPAPAVWKHRRGHHLLYAGRTHAFFGASETLKSWAAQAAVAETLTAGGDVLYIDYEDDQDGVTARLTALGVPRDTILERLSYHRPDEPLMDRHDTYTRGGLDFHQVLVSRNWQLAVIDGMTEAMTTEGLDVNDNADAARFQRRLMRPIADTGAATLAIDHQAKNADTGGRFAIGAQHKLAGLTGAAYRFESMHPLGRPDGDKPTVGTTRITVSKDRPGYVRGHSRDGVAGILRVTSWPDHAVDVDLVDPADLGDEGADLELVGRILNHLGTYEGESANQLEKSVQGKAAAIRASLKWMVGKAWIEVRKEGNAHRHYLTDEGRKEVPDA